jgi:hypothetical protein
LHGNANNESDDSIDSADCDEKRSYTPEPRHLETLQRNENKSFLNHSIIGLKGSASASGSVSVNNGTASVYGGINAVYKS